MKNWKTTFAGLVPGLILFGYGTLQSMQAGKAVDWRDLLIGAGLCVLGSLAKDFNVTGAGGAK